MTNQVNVIQQNANLFNDAKSNVSKELAGREVATNTRGDLYVRDNTGTITTMRPSDYLKNKNDVIALTNDDLLYYRQTSPQLVYNEVVLQDLAHTVGLPTILKHVETVINNFKPTEISGYSTKTQNLIQKGMTHLTDGDVAKVIAASPDGVYKISTKETIVDSGIQEALKYLISTLPNAYKQVLTAKAAVENYNPDALLAQMLIANTPRSIAAQYDETASKEAGLTRDKISDKREELTLAEKYATGEGLPPTKFFDIAVKNASNELFVFGQDCGPIREEDGLTIKGNVPNGTSLPQLLQDAYGVKANIQPQTVVFGNQLKKKKKTGGIVYTGSNMYRVVMAATTTPKGEVVPDFELQNTIENIVKESKGKDLITINQSLNEVCPGARYNNETKSVELPSNKTAVFFVFQGVAADNYCEFKANPQYYKKNDDYNVDAYIDAVKYGSANHKKDAIERKTDNIDIGWFQTWRTSGHLYTANVWLPANHETLSATIYNKAYVPVGTHENITQQAEYNDRRKAIEDGFRSGSRQTN